MLSAAGMLGHRMFQLLREPFTRMFRTIFDDTYFLKRSGPMEGDALCQDLRSSARRRATAVTS